VELETNIVSSNPFRGFCQSIIDDHARDWPPSERVLADKFVRFFGLGPLPQRLELEQLLARLGIRVSTALLPDELVGFHCSYGEAREIIISEQEPYWLSAEHTILHELREMLEHTFSDLGFWTSSGKLPENRAEEFALSVRVWGLGEVLDSHWEDFAKGQSWWDRSIALFLTAGCIAYSLACRFLPLWESLDLARRKQSGNHISRPRPAFPETYPRKFEAT
jgi:hypothetical protein